MSNLLDLNQTLERLDRLQTGIVQAATRAAQLERSAQQALARSNRQFDNDVAGLEEKLSAAISAAELIYEERRKRAENRHGVRRARLSQAQKSAREQAFRTIANDEAKEIFHIQRNLLQASKDLETGRAQADEVLATTQAELDAERAAIEGLHRGAFDTFLAFPSFRRWLDQPASPTDLPAQADEGQLLQQIRTLRDTAGTRLTHLRRSPLPALFRVLPFSFLVVLLAGLCAAAVPTFHYAKLYALTWPQAALAFGATLALTTVLHQVSKRSASGDARTIAVSVTRAHLFLETAAHLATARHQQTQQRLSAEAEGKTSALQEHWQEATRRAESRREETRRRLDTKLARALEHNTRHHRARLTEIETARVAHGARMREETDAQRALAEAQRSARRSESDHQSHAEWVALETDWRELTQPAFATLAAAAATAGLHFPSWTDPVWDGWTPPAEFLPAAPFGQLEIDLGASAGSLLQDPRFALPGPAHLAIPLLLTFPHQGSILFETKETGREAVLGALNNLVLRLLAAAPPGRARFTVLDPVGLGQSFAGLMHLTDHEDRLVNRRIWTQPDHIEQRLGELNEHVEKVTQLYLRNEYATIAEYNEQAGRIAEPYQFLVVADFPSNFSDLAIKRLLSLAASGPRCGIFLFVHRDLRKTPSADFVADDLRQASVVVRHEGASFALAGRSTPDAQLTLASPPDPDRATAFLQRVGRSSIEANRVEVPFGQITPPAGSEWTLETTAELRVPIGRTGATKLQYLALGKGTRQHALIAGKTGSGKSTLFHVVVTNLALWCSPDQVEFYLVDFKKGVEFKCYATRRLPHARVVAIESDREFGLSVLQRIDAELHRRGDLFRDLGAQDLPGYKRAGGTAVLPRTLLVIDEFQELFTEDDRIAQNAALLLDRLVRQGRAFGIHVLLGSQTLGGAYTLARTTLGQMVVRIALQCNEADAMLIMNDDNPAPRLLSRPGEAIYNDSAGAIEGNSPFQIVWLPDEERDACLARVSHLAAASSRSFNPPVVFEGNTPADVRDNHLLENLLHADAVKPPTAPRFWLGAPNAIKGPTEITLHRQSGNHVLMIGQYDESSLALLGLGCLTLAAQHRRGEARFLILDSTPSGSPHRDFLERIVQAMPHPCTLLTPMNLGEHLNTLVASLDNRAASDPTAGGPSTYLIIHHLERFKMLRYEEDFGISMGGADAKPAPGQQFNRILAEGSAQGVHVLCLCDTYNNATRFLNRRALAEFEWRVLFQMNANDSASLIDSPKASTLGLYRALLHSARDGTLETFRPYALPDSAWITMAGQQLARVLG